MSPAAASRALRVLVAGAHPVVRMGLVRLIGGQRDMRMVAAVSTRSDVAAQWRAAGAIVGVYDFGIAAIAAPATVRRVQAEDPGAKVIVIARAAENQFVRRLRSAGAKGLVPLESPAEHVLDAIRTVAEGGESWPRTIEERSGRACRRELTVREAGILQLIARGATNSGIVSCSDLSFAIVKRDVASILRKLGARSRTQAVARAFVRGIVDTDDVRGPMGPIAVSDAASRGRGPGSTEPLEERLKSFEVTTSVVFG